MPNSPENLEKIVEQCILMEIQAMRLYTTLANVVTDEETSSMLRYLAEMEESHVTRLVEIFSGTIENSNKALSQVDVVKAFQSEAWRMHKARLAGAGLTETSPLDDYLTYAIVAESHARSHYDRLSAESGDAKAKEIFRVAKELGEKERLVLVIKGINIEGEDVRKTVAVQLAEAGDGRKRLAAAGLTISAFGEDVRVAAVRFGSRAKKSGFEQGFEVAAVKVATDRPSEHWVYIPALALIGFVYFFQRSRTRLRKRAL